MGKQDAIYFVAIFLDYIYNILNLVIMFLGAFFLLGFTSTNFIKFLYKVDNVIKLTKHNMNGDSKKTFLKSWCQKKIKNLLTQNVALYYYMRVVFKSPFQYVINKKFKIY
jgi:hypothetical protein